MTIITMTTTLRDITTRTTTLSTPPLRFGSFGFTGGVFFPILSIYHVAIRFFHVLMTKFTNLKII